MLQIFMVSGNEKMAKLMCNSKFHSWMIFANVRPCIIFCVVEEEELGTLVF